MSEHVCGKCNQPGTMSAAAAVILLYAPSLPKPYPLIPAEDYHVCKKCSDAIYTLIDKSADAHPTTRQAGQWTRAILLFEDGSGFDVKRKGIRPVGLC